jgi:hypothetical protein
MEQCAKGKLSCVALEKYSILSISYGWGAAKGRRFERVGKCCDNNCATRATGSCTKVRGNFILDTYQYLRNEFSVRPSFALRSSVLRHDFYHGHFLHD